MQTMNNADADADADANADGIRTKSNMPPPPPLWLGEIIHVKALLSMHRV